MQLDTTWTGLFRTKGYESKESYGLRSIEPCNRYKMVCVGIDVTKDKAKLFLPFSIRKEQPLSISTIPNNTGWFQKSAKQSKTVLKIRRNKSESRAWGWTL